MLGPIQIKRPDVAAEIRELADITGLSITDAIGRAVRSQLALERVKASKALLEKRRDAELALARLRSLPIVGPIITDKDLYDSEGLPK